MVGPEVDSGAEIGVQRMGDQKQRQLFTADPDPHKHGKDKDAQKEPYHISESRNLLPYKGAVAHGLEKHGVQGSHEKHIEKAREKSP